MSKIKVIIKRPDEEKGHVTAISNTLKNLQKTVGGYIEVVQLDMHDGTVLICNEDGKLIGLPSNCRCMGYLLVGTIIIAGFGAGDFTDVSDKTVELWKKGELFSYE